MKLLSALILFILLGSTALSQTVASNCNAADSVKVYYRTDAQRLALSRIYRSNSAYRDSAHIPPQITDSILKALIAIYNCPLPECDTVTSFYPIHVSTNGYDLFSLNEMVMYVDDTTEQWVRDVINYNSPNSDTAVDDLLTKYHFMNYDLWSFNATNRLILASDSNYNMNAVGKEWLNIKGVWNGVSAPKAWGSLSFDSDRFVLDTITSVYISFTFKHGWSDCPSGCICNRYWQFKVYYNCDVEFVKSWGGTEPWCALAIKDVKKYDTRISPNPFDDMIKIETKAALVNYKLLNTTGQLMTRGTLDHTGIIKTPDIPKGIYILQLFSGSETETIRLIKE